MHLLLPRRRPVAATVALAALTLTLAVAALVTAGPAPPAGTGGAGGAPVAAAPPAGPDPCAAVVAQLAAAIVGTVRAPDGGPGAPPAEVDAALDRWRTALPGPVDAPEVDGDVTARLREAAGVAEAAAVDRRVIDAAVAQRCGPPP
jgi:hypothetical protein